MSQQQQFRSYQQQSSDPTSGGGVPPADAESQPLTSTTTPSSASPVRRNISNLSLEDSEAGSSLTIVKGFGPIPKIRGHKKWLLGITLGFILLSVVMDRIRGGDDDDNGDGSDGISSASIPTSTSAFGPLLDSEEEIGVHSCGSYFEPVDIMKLKDSSTVENLPNGAVASDNKVCSVMGTKIMQDRDGNAVDAAVATALCLGVVNPASSGIGGGAFILVHADYTHHEAKVGHKAYVKPKFMDLRNESVAKEGLSRRPVPNKSDDEGRRAKEGKKITEFIDGRGECMSCGFICDIHVFSFANNRGDSSSCKKFIIDCYFSTCRNGTCCKYLRHV